MNLELDGKTAVVTGSSRGLGLASAAALVQEGCQVTICARDQARLEKAADEAPIGTAKPKRRSPVKKAAAKATEPRKRKSRA